jgi:hypothetical protein
MKNTKGQGNSIHNALAATQKAKLTMWIAEQNSKTKETYQELAEVAEKHLGFVVTKHNVENLWVAVHGKRMAERKKPNAGKSDLDLINHKIMVLAEKIAFFEAMEFGMFECEHPWMLEAYQKAHKHIK